MRFQRLSALFLALLLGVSMAAAAAPAWTPLGPFGGSVLSITADPAHRGVLYAVTTRGVFRTADAGNLWTPVYSALLVEGWIAVDPLHPGTLYLTGASGGPLVLKSTDAGVHWSSIAAGLPLAGSILAVDPVRPRRLYAGQLGSGFWWSPDAGASWQPAGPSLPRPLAVFAIATAPRPTGKLLIATDKGVYRSTDAGASWIAVRGGLPAGTARAAAFASRTAYVYFDGSGLYRSNDDGASWRKVLKARDRPAAEISISPRTPGVVYVRFGDSTLFRSTNGGQRWVRLSAPMASAVAADPFAANRVYASLYPSGATGGVWSSGDQGQSWTARNRGMTGVQATSMAIQNGDPRRLWITTGLGSVLRTTDGGASWFQNPGPAGETLLQVYSGPGSRTFAHTWGDFATSHLWSTDDNGGSWTQLPVPVLQSERLALLSVPTVPSTLYATVLDDPVYGGGVQTVRRSTDGGDHWEITQEFTLTCGLGEMAAAPSNPSVLYVGGCKGEREAGVVRSGDGGATFTDVSAGLPGSEILSLAVAPGAPDTVWAGTSGHGVWKTTDGGASWAPAGGELEGLAVTALLAPGVSGRVYAALQDGRIFRSDDGGASWTDWTGALPRSSVYDLIALPGAPRRVYAVTRQGIWVLNEAD